MYDRITHFSGGKLYILVFLATFLSPLGKNQKCTEISWKYLYFNFFINFFTLEARPQSKINFDNQNTYFWVQKKWKIRNLAICIFRISLQLRPLKFPFFTIFLLLPFYFPTFPIEHMIFICGLIWRFQNGMTHLCRPNGSKDMMVWR